MDIIFVEDEHYNILQEYSEKLKSSDGNGEYYPEKVVQVEGDGRCGYVCFLRMLEVFEFIDFYLFCYFFPVRCICVFFFKTEDFHSNYNDVKHNTTGHSASYTC